MREIAVNKELIAFCGLYCGACKAYLKYRCEGCHKNDKATWCKIRSCCQEHKYSTCANCQDYPDPKACKKYHNFMAKIFAFVLDSNRSACIARIKEVGLEAFAKEMAEKKRQTLARKTR